MKVVDKKLLFINSSERDSGYTNDFKISLPSHLLACDPHQKMRLVLNDLVLPYTWYNVQASNNAFTYIERSGQQFHAHTITLEEGSYTATQLKDLLQAVLTETSATFNLLNLTFTVKFEQTTAKFTFDCGVQNNNTALFEFEFRKSNSAHKLLGFAQDTVNVSSHATGQLISSQSVSMMFADALLFHTDVLNTNVDKGTGEQSSFHLSNVFAKIAVNTSPFNNIIFHNINDDYLVNIPDKRVTEFRFWFTTDRHQEIALNDDFSFTLKVEVVEDDEKTLISQNTGIGELLKLLVLQNAKARN